MTYITAQVAPTDLGVLEWHVQLPCRNLQLPDTSDPTGRRADGKAVCLSRLQGPVIKMTD